MSLESVPENDIMKKTFKLNITNTNQNGLMSDSNVLTCYDKKQWDSKIEFLYILSTSMQHILIGVAVTGVLMNLTGVYILSSRKSMKNTFNQLLVSLYCMDSLFLVAYVYLSLSLSYMKVLNTLTTIISRCTKLFYSFAFKCSIFLTVTTSHERYIAMQHPLIHSVDMSTGRHRRLRLIKYILPITISAIILSVPEYMEFEFVWKMNDTSNVNKTFSNER